MTFTSPGGGGSDLPDWVVPLVFVLIVLVPALLGLSLRWWDRRRGAPAETDGPVVPKPKDFTPRFVLFVGVLLVGSLGFAVAGLQEGALPLVLLLLLVTTSSDGIGPRW